MAWGFVLSLPASNHLHRLLPHTLPPSVPPSLPPKTLSLPPPRLTLPLLTRTLSLTMPGELKPDSSASAVCQMIKDTLAALGFRSVDGALLNLPLTLPLTPFFTAHLRHLPTAFIHIQTPLSRSLFVEMVRHAGFNLTVSECWGGYGRRDGLCDEQEVFVLDPLQRAGDVEQTD